VKGKYDMELVPDCIREILLTIEEKGTNDNYLLLSDFADIKDDKDVILYNIKLLLDENYIIGKIQNYNDEIGDVIVDRITMSGHKYLDNIRDIEIWDKTKETVFAQMKSASISVLSAVAVKIISAKLGL
jgi:hypothetical protein